MAFPFVTDTHLGGYPFTLPSTEFSDFEKTLLTFTVYSLFVAIASFCLPLNCTHTQEMEPQDSSPLKTAHFADLGKLSLSLLLSRPRYFFFSIFLFSGIGLTSLGDSWNMESNRLSGGEGSPPIGLGLELGRGSGHIPTGITKSCGFTVFQFQELQLQSLIYKYMEAGLPVPHHLLLPIWKSFSGSLGGLHGSPYQLYSGCKYPQTNESLSCPYSIFLALIKFPFLVQFWVVDPCSWGIRMG